MMNDIKAIPVPTTLGLYYLIYHNGTFIESCDASEKGTVIDRIRKEYEGN